jgi:flavin-dependent dehydrogenase
MYSPKGHRVAFEYEDLRPTALKFDKSELLRGLLELCETAGVDIRTNTMALNGRDNGKSITLVVRGEHGQYELEAKKLLIAEGVNRRLSRGSSDIHLIQYGKYRHKNFTELLALTY